MASRILDAEEIRRFFKAGWSHTQIADHYGLAVTSIVRSLGQGREWDSDPTLRARWEARLPAMKAAIRAEALDKAQDVVA